MAGASQRMIKSKLERHSGKRIIRGTVNIQGASTRNNERVQSQVDQRTVCLWKLFYFLGFGEGFPDLADELGFEI